MYEKINLYEDRLRDAQEAAANALAMGEVKDADAANVLMVQVAGVVLMKARAPMEVRRALNAAVKAGELGHIKKDGLLPEAYHHKHGRANALELREAFARVSIAAIKKVMC